MRKVRVCIDEIVSYEFDVEIADDATDTAVAESAHDQLAKVIGTADCVSTVHESEVTAIDGRRFNSIHN